MFHFIRKDEISLIQNQEIENHLFLKAWPQLNFGHKKSPSFLKGSIKGWKTGFEPATSGTTIRRSNQLSYNHHFNCGCKCNLFLLFPKEKNHFQKEKNQIKSKIESTAG